MLINEVSTGTQQKNFCVKVRQLGSQKLTNTEHEADYVVLPPFLVDAFGEALVQNELSCAIEEDCKLQILV